MEQLISIIVPVYNVEYYINRCIQSLLNQTFTNLEIILIDDGSKDRSGAICEDWARKDRRIIVVHQKNGGAGAARNAGLKIAKGKYIAFVDADDWVAPKMYETLYNLITQYSADICICGMATFKGQLPIVSDQKRHDIEVWETKKLLDTFFRVNGEEDTHSVCNKLIKSSVLEGYHFLEGTMNEDIETCYYLATRVKNATITTENFYYYFLNIQGVTRSKFTEKKLDLIKVWDVVKSEASRLTPEYQQSCEMNIKRARFTLLSQMLINGYDHKNEKLKYINIKLKRQVRKDYFTLLRWKMPFSRKVLLTIVCL